jgi:WD40 repeat protein
MSFAAFMLVIIPVAPGQGQQGNLDKPTGPKFDAHGDVLPPAALGRLGSSRFRHRNLQFAGLTPDGKGVILYGREGLAVMDADTGLVSQWSTSNHLRRDEGFFGRSNGPLTQLVFPNRGDGFYSILLLRDRQIRLEAVTASATAVLLPESFEEFDFSVFDAATGKRLHRLRTSDLGDNGRLSYLAISGDGKFIVTQAGPVPNGKGGTEGGPGTVHCFDALTKHLRYDIAAPKQGSWRTHLSDDGNILLLAFDNVGKGELQLWDIAKGEEIRKFELKPDQAARLQLTKDGKHLFALNSDSSAIRHVDATTGAELHTFVLGKDAVHSFLASRDCKALFVITAAGIEQWDVPRATKLRTLVPGYGDKRIALSPAGDRLFFVGDTAVMVWDTATGKLLRPAAGHLTTVWSMSFSPDGRQLLTASSDGTARLWDTRTQEHLREFALTGRANHGLYGAEPFAEAPFVQAGFSSSGKQIVTALPNAPVDVWDVATGNKETLIGQDPKQGSIALAYSQRDNLVATVAPDGRIRVWDVAHGERRLDFQWQPTKDGGRQLDLAAVAFAPSGSTLAVAGLYPPRHHLKLFETSTGKLRLDVDLTGKLQRDLGEVPALVLAQRLVTRLAYSGDGKVLALAGVHAIHLHDAATGKERMVLGGLHTFGPSVSLSPDGKLAAAGTLDGYLRLWDMKSGRLLCEVKGHDYFIAATAFSPDGKMLASASNDTTVLLWDMALLLQQPLPPGPSTAAILDRLWDDLSSSDAAKAFAAMSQLTEAATETPAYFKDRLHSVPVPDPKRVDALVADLDSEQYAVRQKATAELEKLSDLAVPALRAQLAKNSSLETSKRIELLLERIHGPLANPELLRALRAVEVLDAIGTPHAWAVLEVLAKGAPAHRLTQAAQDSLKRQRR